MLVLSRRAQEKIYIGENIVITIASIDGSHVRIGVDAPKDIEVHREEVFKRIKERKENEKSA